MRKTKVMNLIKIILLIVIIMLSVSNPIYARQVKGTQGDGGDSGSTATRTIPSGAEDIVKQADSFLEKGKSQTAVIGEDDMKKMSDSIYSILLVVGIIAAFIIGGILAIKFITGGVEGQAQVKAMLIPYIAGCIVVFGAFTIWKIVVTVLQG